MAAAHPREKLFASSGLDDDAFVSTLTPQAQKDLYVSSPGFTPSSLPTAGQTFVTNFTSAFGHAPSSQAIFGYAAMEAVLGALRKAGSGAGNRTTVVKALIGERHQSSVLGTISIRNGGDVRSAHPQAPPRLPSSCSASPPASWSCRPATIREHRHP